MDSRPPSTRKIPFTTTGTVLLHIDFLLLGIVMTFLGPILPILASRWHMSDSKSGALFFAQFFSSMFGMLLSSLLVQRWGYRLALMLGLVLMAGGMSLLGVGSYWLGVAAVCILGLGYGITSPAGNLRTAELDPLRSASALNVINAVWGIGAMLCSLLLKIAQEAHHPAWFLHGTALALLALVVVFSLVRFDPDTRKELTEGPHQADGLWTSRMLPVICALFFIYVGTETSFGAWVATYGHRLSPTEHSYWTIIPSFYWGALLVGRMTAPVLLRFQSSVTVAVGGLTIGLLGAFALVSAHGIGQVMLGSVLAGLGLASIFPISVSLLPGWFGGTTRRASGPVFSSGNLGGAVFPWFVGVVSATSNSLRLGFFVPMIGVSAMLAFYIVSNSSARVIAKAENA
jgi:FHS family glucose/mannose:H+ symporter-like MFS transporter